LIFKLYSPNVSAFEALIQSDGSSPQMNLRHTGLLLGKNALLSPESWESWETIPRNLNDYWAGLGYKSVMYVDFLDIMIKSSAPPHPSPTSSPSSSSSSHGAAPITSRPDHPPKTHISVTNQLLEVNLCSDSIAALMELLKSYPSKSSATQPVASNSSVSSGFEATFPKQGYAFHVVLLKPN